MSFSLQRTVNTTTTPKRVSITFQNSDSLDLFARALKLDCCQDHEASLRYNCCFSTPFQKPIWARTWEPTTFNITYRYVFSTKKRRQIASLKLPFSPLLPRLRFFLFTPKGNWIIEVEAEKMTVFPRLSSAIILTPTQCYWGIQGLSSNYQMQMANQPVAMGLLLGPLLSGYALTKTAHRVLIPTFYL